MPNEIYCTNCGKANHPGASFCGACGTKLSQPQYREKHRDQKPVSPFTNILFYIAIVVLAISVIGLICPIGTHPLNPLCPVMINNLEDYNTWWGSCAGVSLVITIVTFLKRKL